MTNRHIYIALMVFMFTACMNRTQKVEPQQLESDSSVVVSDHPITDRLYAELDSSEVYNDSIIYGYWFKLMRLVLSTCSSIRTVGLSSSSTPLTRMTR